MNLVKTLFKRKLVLLAAILLAISILMMIFAPLLASFEPSSIRVSRRLKPPDFTHYFGTDELGRDVFSRILYGGRATLSMALLIVLISVSIGVFLGLIAGYFKKLDVIIMRFVDALMALPDILLAIFLVAVLGASATSVILALSIVYTPRVVRVVRASVLVVAEMPYIEAAVVVGSTTPRILTHHVLLNIASPIMVQATFIFAYSLLAEAGLSFLGAGVPPEIPTWGTMIAASQNYADRAIWTVLFPGFAIILIALSLQIIGDGLRDMLDPQLSKGI